MLLCLSMSGQVSVVRRGAKPAAGGGTKQITQGRACNVGSGHSVNDCAFLSSIGSSGILVAIARWDDAGSGTRTVAFSSPSGVSCTWNTLTAAVPSSVAFHKMASAYCIIPSGGSATVRATYSESTVYSDLVILELSNVSSLDVSAVADGKTANTAPCASGPTGTLSNVGDLVIGFCGMWDYSTAWGNAGGWNYYSSLSGASDSLAVFSSTAETTAAQSFSYSITADRFTSLVAAFK